MKKLPDIDAILFDMMGVLLFQKEVYEVDAFVDEVDSFIGGVTNDSFFEQEMLKKFCITEEDLQQVLLRIVEKYSPLEKLWDLLPELKKHYKLAVINNGTGLTLTEFDKRLNFDKYFNLFVCSGLEGVKKPEKEIFLATVSRLGVEPNRCLFMDDSQVNVEGAEVLGMKTILWESKEGGFKNFAKLLGI